MLNTKTIAHQVTNLTDARYFAAWGVDYISYNCDPQDPNFISDLEIVEIQTWIEGPGILGYFGSLQGEIEERTEALSLDGVLSNDQDLNIIDPNLYNEIKGLRFIQINRANGSKLIDRSMLIIKLKSAQLLAVLEKQAPPDSYFLLVEDIDLSDVTAIINNKQYGMVLNGSKENKVGVKTFDLLDDIFDLLLE